MSWNGVDPISHNPWHMYRASGPVAGPATELAMRRAASTTSGPKSALATSSAS